MVCLGAKAPPWIGGSGLIGSEAPELSDVLFEVAYEQGVEQLAQVHLTLAALGQEASTAVEVFLTHLVQKQEEALDPGPHALAQLFLAGQAA
jgi:hypothetical protein